MIGLVSIISEQTIPNFLVIKHFLGNVDKLIFITTHKMETNDIKTSRSAWLANALGINVYDIDRVILREDDYFYNIERLKGSIDENNEIILNITGGTKIMVLSCYDFFKNKGNLKSVVYLPINQNIIKFIYPGQYEEKLKSILTIDDYLKSYGLCYKSEKPEIDYDILSKLFIKFKRSGYDILKFTEGYEDEYKNKYTGHWFEEFIYHKIKDDLLLDENSIKINVKISYYTNFDDSSIDNEFDIFFIHNFKLNILECKVSLGKNKSSNLLQSINKLGAVKRNFGINCNTYIITLSEIENIDDVNRKANIAGINQIIDRRFFLQNKSFKDIFK